MRLYQMTAETAARLRAASLTYPEVGRTAGELPGGYRHLHRSVLIGYGPQVFTDAAAALMSWRVHLRAGLGVCASGPAAAPGAVVILRIPGAAPVRLTAPCRVVYDVSEPARRGFAYGTLPGHPESGEEAFIISHGDNDAVTFTITAFSRPATALARAAGPIGRLTQNLITSRYLRAIAGS
jgi:uncharacterized protein (UPF0548 family)